MSNNQEDDNLPSDLRRVSELVAAALVDIEPAGSPKSDLESRGLWLSSQTDAGRSLPHYYLVYFLLIDLLKCPNLGHGEKVAWVVPIRFRDRLYSIEHRKFGVGVFAPTLVANAHMSQKPTDEQEEDAKEITAQIRKAVSIAEPYFVWRAEQAAKTSNLNVTNQCSSLFSRYEYFQGRYLSLREIAKEKKAALDARRSASGPRTVVEETGPSYYELQRDAKWEAQAAIDAFFSWAEHSFIHIAILFGLLRTGDEVAKMAESDWKSKFKLVIDISDPQAKKYYDTLLDLRAQIRNYMAHGSFGKQGQAFNFHSGAGAVPVLLTQDLRHRYSLSGNPAFDEGYAIDYIKDFLDFLWSGPRAPAKQYLFSDLPSILTYACDGGYAVAMKSEADMEKFVSNIIGRFEQAGNMDW